MLQVARRGRGRGTFPASPALLRMQPALSAHVHLLQSVQGGMLQHRPCPTGPRCLVVFGHVGHILQQCQAKHETGGRVVPKSFTGFSHSFSLTSCSFPRYPEEFRRTWKEEETHPGGGALKHGWQNAELDGPRKAQRSSRVASSPQCTAPKALKRLQVQ